MPTKQYLTGNMPFIIYTDTIQKYTGANRVVASSQSILERYEDIELFPIRGGHVDDITIICTGK